MHAGQTLVPPTAVGIAANPAAITTVSRQVAGLAARNARHVGVGLVVVVTSAAERQGGNRRRRRRRIALH